jgi:hypothetical protein
LPEQPGRALQFNIVLVHPADPRLAGAALDETDDMLTDPADLIGGVSETRRRLPRENAIEGFIGCERSCHTPCLREECCRFVEGKYLSSP